MSDPIHLIQTVHLIQPLQPLTAHKQQKYNFTLQNISAPAWKHPALSKKNSNSSLSLPSQVSFSVLPKTPFSLSPTDDAGTLAKRTPSLVANGPTSSESSKLSGTLSFSLYPSLPHSFSHLTSLISSVLQGHLRTPAQLCLYLYCTAWFQSPSQPPATAVTASLKYSHINGFWTEKRYV